MLIVLIVSKYITHSCSAVAMSFDTINTIDKKSDFAEGEKMLIVLIVSKKYEHQP